MFALKKFVWDEKIVGFQDAQEYNISVNCSLLIFGRIDQLQCCGSNTTKNYFCFYYYYYHQIFGSKKTYFHLCSHRGKSDVITKRIHRYLLTPLSYILEGFERMKYMKRMLSSACKITGGSSYLEFISLTSTDS